MSAKNECQRILEVKKERKQKWKQKVTISKKLLHKQKVKVKGEQVRKKKPM